MNGLSQLDLVVKLLEDLTLRLGTIVQPLL